MRLFLYMALALASPMALAMGGEHHAEIGIPWKTIVVQCFNLTLLFGVLTYYLRKAVIKHFQERQATYMQLVQKADAAKNEAERNRQEISQRLTQLQSSAKGSVEQAKSEAEELRARIVAEAKELSKKLGEEAARAIQVELDRAKAQLRKELVVAAIEMAGKKMKDIVGGPEQKKLQNEFVEKIQVVR